MTGMSKAKKTLANENIQAQRVLLISDTGEKLGVMPTSEALDKARDKQLDLVQVSAGDADPCVCKLMNFGRHLFEMKKQRHEAKQKQKKVQLKEIKMRPATDIGDYNIKLKKMKGFLEDGHKVKVTIRFRGRELSHKELGLEMIKRIVDDMQDLAIVEQEAKLEGKQMSMVLSQQKK